MTVAMLVLGTALLCILGLLATFMPQRRVPGLDESSISAAEQLDVARAIQRKMRIAELQRRVANRNWLAYALLGMALLMQIAALAADHLAHPSIAAVSVVPAFFIVLSAQASRRRDAQRQLKEILGSRAFP